MVDVVGDAVCQCPVKTGAVDVCCDDPGCAEHACEGTGEDPDGPRAQDEHRVAWLERCPTYSMQDDAERLCQRGVFGGAAIRETGVGGMSDEKGRYMQHVTHGCRTCAG